MIGTGVVSAAHGTSRRWLAVVIVATLATALATTGPASRADDTLPTAAAVKSLLDGVRDDLDAERPGAARDRFVKAIDALTTLVGAEPPPAAARGLLERARTLRDDLELQGGEVDAIVLPTLPRAAAKPKGESAAKPAKPSAGPSRAGSRGRWCGRAPCRGPAAPS